jgi:hypothetical protein
METVKQDYKGNITFIDEVFMYFTHPIIILGYFKSRIFPNAKGVQNQIRKKMQNIIKTGAAKNSIIYNGKRIFFLTSTPHLHEESFVQMKEIFVDEVYKSLNPKDSIVLDIGAYIGDTAIYFALNGAKHIYSWEIDKTAYDIAVHNIELNHLEKKITLINKPATKDTIDNFISIHKHEGRKTLKLDCEGTEYDIILNSNKIADFDNIIMEYHYGYLNLEKYLKKHGFKVTHTSPKPGMERLTGAVGFIYAWRD